MTIKEAIRQVATDLNIEECVVRRVYYSMFEFIKDTVADLPLKTELLDEEEFKEVSKVFCMPALGKIIIPYHRYNKVWEGYLNKKKKKNKDVQTKEDKTDA